jgi:hypothetical protein
MSKTKEQEQITMTKALPENHTMIWNGTTEGSNSVNIMDSDNDIVFATTGEYSQVVSDTWSAIREVRYEIS